MPALTNERLFFEHIALQIKKLTKTYTYVLEEIEKQKFSASAALENNIEYGLLLQRLNRAINVFKQEVTSSPT